MSDKKIVSLAELKKRLATERRKKKKIIFTNGCFDLVHVGHIKVLTFCRSLGDVLVVGLNSDASVTRLKGKERPLIPQKERAQLLASLESVSYVTIFKEDTPERLIKLVQPDVLVKGGDWTTDKIVGKDIAKEVVRVPLVKGHSTTALIELIIERYGKGHTNGFETRIPNGQAS